jgi:hypothetical protein
MKQKNKNKKKNKTKSIILIEQDNKEEKHTKCPHLQAMKKMKPQKLNNNHHKNLNLK